MNLVRQYVGLCEAPGLFSKLCEICRQACVLTASVNSCSLFC